MDETADRLGDVVRRTVTRGGKTIIPAFSVGRTQAIIYFLHQRSPRRETAGSPDLRGQPDGSA
ncbi:MAG: hypothetical protein U0793_21765 [Gemmataceae bacterium]